MVDQHTHTDAGDAGPVGAVGIAAANAIGFAAAGGDAMRELAQAIGDLAQAIRDTAAYAELEFVPCEELASTEQADATNTAVDGPAGRSGDRDNSSNSGAEPFGDASNVAALPLVPAQRQREPEPTSGAESESRSDSGPGSGSLCRPGGCGCGQPDVDVGRHARRDSNTDDSTDCGSVVGARIKAVRGGTW